MLRIQFDSPLKRRQRLCETPLSAVSRAQLAVRRGVLRHYFEPLSEIFYLLVQWKEALEKLLLFLRVCCTPQLVVHS